MLPPIDRRSRALLDWFDARFRDLPWRRDTDPYRVWVSEIMLQQTRVETVVPRFRRWLERFPSLAALADAGVDDVLAEWEGLGYYTRARNLHAAARVVRDSRDGRIPESATELRELPGIGEYTAGAIASIAFRRPEPAIDTNARRVLCRLFDLPEPSPRELRARAIGILPAHRPGDFNQALMELGATVCLPRRPRCAECPFAPDCRARRQGTIDARPRRGARRPVPTFRLGVAVSRAPSGRVLLVRRVDRGMLGGLWQFPSRLVEPGETEARAARRVARALLPRIGRGRALAVVPHAYSHRVHEYHAFAFRVASESDPDPRALAAGGWTRAEWVPLEAPDRALPAAQRRIARALNEPPC